MDSHEILMEIQRIGTAVRVSAIDAETGTEVVFQAPASTGNAELRELAVKKMAYVLKKDAKTREIKHRS